MSVFDKIKVQQEKAGLGAPAYYVGCQLADMLRAEPELIELVEKDIEVSGMGIADCEKKIKELADKKHKENKTNFAFVSPTEAEEVIRKFYGLPERGKDAPSVAGGNSSPYTGWLAHTSERETEKPPQRETETPDWMDELLI